METSILKSTKKVLGIDAAVTSWDLDILTLINSAFSDLTQLGVGPTAGFMIEDDSVEWADYIPDDDVLLNSVKNYIWLRAREVFDPPTTSYAIQAMKDQIARLEWRMNVKRESTEWVDPDPPVIIEEVP